MNCCTSPGEIWRRFGRSHHNLPAPPGNPPNPPAQAEAAEPPTPPVDPPYPPGLTEATAASQTTAAQGQASSGGGASGDGGAVQIDPALYIETPDPQKCVASHVKRNAKEEIRTFMEFYVAALFFFVYTLHFFTHLIQHPGYLVSARIVYILAIIIETAIWCGALLRIRKVYYSGPQITADPAFPNSSDTTGHWNWNIVCQDELGVGNPTWKSGISSAERVREFSYDPYEYEVADPVTGLVLTDWDVPEERTCGPYLLYFATPFRQLATDMWYPSAALRTVIAISYFCIFFQSFVGCKAVWNTIRPKHRAQVGVEPPTKTGFAEADKQKSIDRHVSMHQQKLVYEVNWQYFFTIVEALYNLLFTVCSSV